MYKNYIFDLYGTLIDINTNENKPYLWEKMVNIYGFQGASYTRKELREKYTEYCMEELALLRKNKNVKYPEIQIDKVFRRLYEEKGAATTKELIVFTAQMFRVVSTRYIRLYDGVIPLLETLKKRGKKIYLLSNAQYEFTIYEMNSLGITEYFDGIVISSCEECQKPDPAFFNTLLQRYHLSKEESIMIGNDKTTDILGAHQIGLDSLYISSNLSPEIDERISCKAQYIIDDGDVKKISKLIVK